MSPDIARHTFEEHVGEVRLRLRAPTLGGVFEAAARALAELLAGEVAAEPDAPAERVHLEATDRAALLAEWLNELIFLSETRRRVYPLARVEDVGERTLAATVRGAPLESVKTAVKAATLHDLRVERVDEGWTATVVLDV